MMTMVEVIVANQGIVNKFGGDSLLAVFGTPLNPADDHAARAVCAARDMQQALAAFNGNQLSRQAPPLETGIGVATGDVIAGNVGGRERIEYTVQGRHRRTWSSFMLAGQNVRSIGVPDPAHANRP